MSEGFKSNGRNVDHAEFICENCKNAVTTAEPACPHCGALFFGVKCPQCNYSGKIDFFVTGCPRCGFVRSDQKLSDRGDNAFFLSKSSFWILFSFFLVMAVAVGYVYRIFV